jgi:hypothetical protein
LKNKKAEQVLPGSDGGWRGKELEGRGEVAAQTMFIHMNKYKNNKKIRYFNSWPTFKVQFHHLIFLFLGQGT